MPERHACAEARVAANAVSFPPCRATNTTPFPLPTTTPLSGGDSGLAAAVPASASASGTVVSIRFVTSITPSA